MADPATNPRPSRKRSQTPGEEIANSVSHGVGAAAALAALPFLVAAALEHGAAAVVGASVFAGTAFVLYLTSTLYHALPPGRAKRVFHVLDHSAIFLLIAGTYTPFTLGVLGGSWGWTLFGIVWTLAVLGIVSKSVAGIRYPALSTALYVAMGWLIVVAIRPLWLRMPGPGLAWLVAGGLAYTVGVAFYAAPRLRYAHFVFHLFVVAGTACHWVAVYRYAA
ncbi:MAG TPA: hemolysin III family protein [Thermoanaerobaculia bacterium]|nr:hemolysin III family protein [Thermoanaerobaculia bacterium]HQR66762.1 hemolysin III family protein [Thermoanaerobaculia bacterium]